jgi:hypothetical protein
MGYYVEAIMFRVFGACDFHDVISILASVLTPFDSLQDGQRNLCLSHLMILPFLSTIKEKNISKGLTTKWSWDGLLGHINLIDICGLFF